MLELAARRRLRLRTTPTTPRRAERRGRARLRRRRRRRAARRRPCGFSTFVKGPLGIKLETSERPRVEAVTNDSEHHASLRRGDEVVGIGSTSFFESDDVAKGGDGVFSTDDCYELLADAVERAPSRSRSTSDGGARPTPTRVDVVSTTPSRPPRRRTTTSASAATTTRATTTPPKRSSSRTSGASTSPPGRRGPARRGPAAGRRQRRAKRGLGCVRRGRGSNARR